MRSEELNVGRYHGLPWPHTLTESKLLRAGTKATTVTTVAGEDLGFREGIAPTLPPLM